MFISDNRQSFRLWWKENLVKHQKVLKYYQNWLSAKGFLAFYVFIHEEICQKQSYLGLNLSKKRSETNLKLFQYQISTAVKDRKSSYQVRKKLGIFAT